jgi:WD repeat-containing protein 35
MWMQGVSLTREQERLLYLISLYSKPAQNSSDEEVWIKDLALKALIYQGIIEKVFNYDYAPLVIMFDGVKRMVNVSMEGEDDINDLRELKLVSRLKLSTSKYNIINAYRVNIEGLEVLKGAKKENLEAVDKLVKCLSCGNLKEVLVEDEEVKFVCKNCGEKKNIPLLEVEDVPYVCKGYLLRNLLLRE